MSTFKKYLLGWAWIFAVTQFVLFLGAVCYLIDIDDANWTTFINAAFPLAWFRLNVMILVIFILDWLSPGHTIQTIMNVEQASSWQDKMISAMFLLGIAGLSVWAISMPLVR